MVEGRGNRRREGEGVRQIMNTQKLKARNDFLANETHHTYHQIIVVFSVASKSDGPGWI